MSEFYFRTESISPEDISSIYVDSQLDREIIDTLKSSKTVILEGSRGTGKSFLMKMAEVELNARFSQDKIFPVYITFVKSSLIHTNDKEQFKNWMLALICGRIIRQLRRKGLLIGTSPATKLLSFFQDESLDSLEEKLGNIQRAYENSYNNPNEIISTDQIPSVSNFIDAMQELCSELRIKRFCFFFDEAVHIFRQEQQRQFFTLFRDLRSPYISCNAAVYPGITSYGDTFEMSHDATYLRIERDILSDDYLDRMKQIVVGQADERLQEEIERNGNNFSVLAYAASGNPRMLLKTIDMCPKSKLATNEVNKVIKDFYRADIWTEHTGLGIKFKGYRSLVDWSRDFLEKEIISETKKKNDTRAEHNESTCYFWIHRDAPETVKKVLRLLEYTGIVRKEREAVRATSSELGTRYEIKLGCIFAVETSPVAVGMNLVKRLTLGRVTEYGMRSPTFQSIPSDILEGADTDTDIKALITSLLDQSVDVLDLSVWQKSILKQNEVLTIKNILEITEEQMKEKILYVGDKRARRIKNAALAELLEYLSG